MTAGATPATAIFGMNNAFAVFIGGALGTQVIMRVLYSTIRFIIP